MREGQSRGQLGGRAAGEPESEPAGEREPGGGREERSAGRPVEESAEQPVEQPVERPHTRLDTVMHSPLRLAVLGVLRHVQQVNFADLRESLDLSVPELSRQLAILEKAGLVEIAKFREQRRAVTRVRLAPTGRERFEEYLVDLRRVVGAE